MTAAALKKMMRSKILGWFLGFWVLALFPAMGKSQNATPSITPAPGQNNKASDQTPMVATAVASLPNGNGLGPIPTAGTAAVSPASQSVSAANDFSLSPQEEAKILNAIDSEENKTATAPAVKPALSYYKPPPVPTGVSIIVLREGVYLSWNTAPAGSTAASYNVYRSTTPGFGYKQMNLKPLTAAYFMDGPPNSYDNPQNGEDYFYVVTTVDGAGNVSPYSDETTAYPSGMDVPQSTEVLKEIKMARQPALEEEKVLNVPEQSVISLKLPADSQLAIQGYKKVDAQIAFQTYNRPNLNGVSNQVNTTTINQELVVNLKGKVGKNVDVNVDYSDVNRAGGVDQTKQDISIVYHGDSDSAIQQVSFGDLQLTLPNTEFAGFSKQLFGLEAVFKFDRFKFTSFFAQTKGIAVTKVFTGNTTQVDKTYQDISFVPFKYFLITRTPSGTAPAGTPYLPQNNSEQIWVYNGSTILNPIGPNFIGIWEHWLPGRDYTIDYTTGIITFIRALSYGSQIAVGFTDSTGTTHGLNTIAPTSALSGSGSNLGVSDTGYVDNKYFLIKDSTTTTTSFSSSASRSFSPLYLVNYFSTGSDKIIPPQQDPGFLFQIVSQGTNNIVQTGQGGTTGTPYVYNLNLDLNILSVVNTTFVSPAAVTYLYFPERPFANLDGIANGTTIVQAGGSAVTDVYASTNGATPTSLYYIHLRYKTQLNFFKLDNINILRGSETVYLDGRLMRRDADYFIDYTTGFLDFQDKSILTPNSQIVVTYEYSPFGSFGSNNILGARAEYSITDNFFVGSTFLMSTSQQPTDTPQIGSTPNSLTLFDADTKYEMDRDELASITSVIPGLENWKPPATLKLSGEIAQSYFNPDTYNAEGEQGVAMVDNMEGIDSAISASLNQTSWLVSSRPDFNYPNPSVTLDGSGDATNNRARFYDDVTGVDFQVNTSTAIPGGGGHVYAQTGQASDVVNVLQFPYSHLSNQSWAGLGQVISTAGTDFSTVQFFQTWLYNDGKDKWIMFDFGVINEDSNGNGVLDSDAVTNQANPNQAYGIPTFYMSGTPWHVAPGTTIQPTKTGFDYGVDPTGHWGFVGLSGGPGSGVTEVSQEGQDNGVFITENMNGTGILNAGTDSYFEYGVRANWTGWQLVKIPVDLTVVTSGTPGTTASGISYFYSNPTTANPQVVRTLRLWATGAGPTSIDGTFLTDSISFTHN
ncbi:MAG TPA: hypothetical protein VK791_00970, partial [bacterium]|nr:hypothetical protein [bacterium]